MSIKWKLSDGGERQATLSDDLYGEATHVYDFVLAMTRFANNPDDMDFAIMAGVAQAMLRDRSQP